MNPIIRRLAMSLINLVSPVRDRFPDDTKGLPKAERTQVARLSPGARYALRAVKVRKRVGNNEVRMLAYNGSVPGPTLWVEQGSEIIVDFTNEIDLETTVHWHGLRLDNRFDGVPEGSHHGMQPPIPARGSFTYRLRFPDPGVYWYHPHIREDYTQEAGLYGNIIVRPTDPNYWPPVNREIALTLDDLLMEGGRIAPFSQTGSYRTAMGRFGNTMLTGGDTSYQLQVDRGEVVRFYLTNTANVRIFSFRIPSARMKLVGSDSGRMEHEEFVEKVVISPSERAVVDVLLDSPGQFIIEHRSPERSYTLGTIEVSERAVERSFAGEFEVLRTSEELVAERARAERDFERAPDKVLSLVGEMPGMKHGAHHMEEIEWEDTMEIHNRVTSPKNMFWKLVDKETGGANHDIFWTFQKGERVKIQIVMDPHSDHPMQHPVHFHGQRFLVLARNEVRNENLAWKDTVLVRTGETVDILLDASNPGVWMVHCHIAEHLESGMMFSFQVRDGEQKSQEHRHDEGLGQEHTHIPAA